MEALGSPAEVGAEEHRQIEIYDEGPTLRYRREHDEDEYGFLSYAKFEDDEDLTPWEIPQTEFERAWASPD